MAVISFLMSVNCYFSVNLASILQVVVILAQLTPDLFGMMVLMQGQVSSANIIARGDCMNRYVNNEGLNLGMNSGQKLLGLTFANFTKSILLCNLLR